MFNDIHLIFLLQICHLVAVSLPRSLTRVSESSNSLNLERGKGTEAEGGDTAKSLTLKFGWAKVGGEEVGGSVAGREWRRDAL